MPKEEYCKICNDGKAYKNLNAHLRNKHNMLRFEYDAEYGKEDEQLEEMNEEEDFSPPSTVEEKQEISTEIDREMKLSEFLDAYNISEEQLRSIMGTKRAFKTSIDMRTELLERQKTARRKCDKLIKTYKNKGDIFKNTDLDVVEMLVNEYGFKVTDVIGKRVNEPKHWVLEKL